MKTALFLSQLSRLSRLHTEIILLANGYMEVACPDYELPEMNRHWLIRRVVDYGVVCLL
ncbi:hypothetical protein [Paraburkholderia acidicola]|uniref:hypothetical protein n=1 Tax=Paraburkholderia acidicola TaxID=1912599 RepID=UPI0012FFA6F6|nr:hypothetical protein [Paraburkholderia acidicola]